MKMPAQGPPACCAAALMALLLHSKLHRVSASSSNLWVLQDKLYS
jgi:hypothetical protein